MQNNNRVPELISPCGRAGLWLVPIEDGWILLSSSKRMTPILAHIASREKPVYDSLPPAAKELIKNYEEHIAYVNKSRDIHEEDKRWHDVEQTDEKAFSRNYNDVIVYYGPLLTTRWNQSGGGSCSSGKIYNKYCPYVNDSTICYKAVTGCVATAIAQIMNYWQWPYAAQIPTTNGGGATELQFYDWSKMPDSIGPYTPMDKVDMLARLLRDCGYRLNMNYGVESAARDDSAHHALWQTFGYDKNSMELCYKWITPGWKNKIRTNIDNGQPIYYSGSCRRGNDCGGHAFVVDGYSTGDYPLFHINWGWGGHYDGWYNLDSAFVNDTTHFESSQIAIFGIKPAPICTDVSLNYSFFFPPKFCYAIGGELTVSNATLNNIIQGQLYSTTQVRLTSGVTISEGSNVHIAIKDVPCPSIPNSASVMAAPAKKGYHIDKEKKEANVFSLSPNPVASILHFNMCDELSHAKIYTINGQCVLQASQTDIDVSALPQGMYILRAQTTDGQQHQAKFIKQ